mmetsp:Transcript_418/g.460  ORF Transcript_418/g.460 Transcript_418/m.460 type:complete len:88 (+) Transcript_418:204-467(+)
MFLGCPNIILLSNCFFLEKFIEFAFGFPGLSIVSLFLALPSVFFKQAEEVQNLGVGRDVYHALLGGGPLKLLPIHIIRVALHYFVFN